MGGDGSAIKKRYPSAPPSVLSLAGGLVSARWLLLVGCCLAAHCLPARGSGAHAHMLAPDVASALFVLAAASALADLRLYPVFYRPPPGPLLLLYELIVSLVGTSWAFSAAWVPLRAHVRATAWALAGALPRALSPADAARLVLQLLALAAFAVVVHATELLPRLMDYYEDWAQARLLFALERRRRPGCPVPLHARAHAQKSGGDAGEAR